ncbi:uncharacterized protein LOC131955156 [Physella acuta]|uniref:uncharacterized protein LOC131955156 n=1 Tax=Physella acuta TaxID=109671 RepID=UPI0027DCF8B9|nr:uncharacterized protein LOC131955156 [Physella acuta]
MSIINILDICTCLLSYTVSAIREIKPGSFNQDLCVLTYWSCSSITSASNWVLIPLSLARMCEHFSMDPQKISRFSRIATLVVFFISCGLSFAFALFRTTSTYTKSHEYVECFQKHDVLMSYLYFTFLCVMPFAGIIGIYVWFAKKLYTQVTYRRLKKLLKMLITTPVTNVVVLCDFQFVFTVLFGSIVYLSMMRQKIESSIEESQKYQAIQILALGHHLPVITHFIFHFLFDAVFRMDFLNMLIGRRKKKVPVMPVPQGLPETISIDSIKEESEEEPETTPEETPSEQTLPSEESVQEVSEEQPNHLVLSSAFHFG